LSHGCRCGILVAHRRYRTAQHAAAPDRPRAAVCAPGLWSTRLVPPQPGRPIVPLRDTGGRQASRGDAEAVDVEAIISTIVSAFRNVGRDDSCTLHEAQLIDQSMGRAIPATEFADAKRLDPQQDWRDVPASSLDECDAALSHLSPKGWCFYIPAYMIRAVELIDQPIWKTSLPVDVVFHLTYPEEEDGLQAYMLDRFDLLDEVQAAAVTAFLEYLVAHAPADAVIRKGAQVALKRYWGLPRNQRPNASVYRPPAT
jgi:hypothetical protein